jgi:Trk K+ transport system NAD-binding subunit
MEVLIIGSGKVGRELAERLEDRGENVVIIDREQDVIEQARRDGLSVYQGDGTDAATLQSAGADNANIVVAATGDDDTNLLVAQLVSSKFDIEQIITRVNDPDNEEVFADLGVRTISETLSTAWAIDNVIERPALAKWMTELGRSGDVQEIEITADELVGKSIHDLDQVLPERVLIALVGRDGETQIPSPDFTLQHGDHITFLGRTEAVREAIEQCHPELRSTEA